MYEEKKVETENLPLTSKKKRKTGSKMKNEYKWKYFLSL
jgi:hypothetical protein